MLDPRLQASAEKAVRATGRPGALVAFEPDNGSVRAVFSMPGERGDPLLAAHVPASTFKTFSALAGLEAGVLTTATTKECTGRYAFGGHEFRCSRVHGTETTAQAIVRSCNSFFFDVATKIEHERLHEMARRFGFGERTGVELADAPGVVPAVDRSAGVTGTALLDAAGHGEIKVTLLQLARAYAVIANGGRLVSLTVTGRERKPPRAVQLLPAHLELVRAALVDVVAAEDGTAHALATAGFPIAGKTGSGEAPPLRPGEAETDDTWFVAYAPPESPKILVAARIERSGPGADAKTAVKAVLDAWRSEKNL